MAKTVGLSRNIKISWLNKAAALYGENLTEEQYKTAMNEYLSFEIESPTNLRKTREILMRVWFYNDDAAVSAYRPEAYRLLQQYPDYDVPVHWCLLLMAYPVFADLCKLTGRIAEFNEVVVLKQLKQKLFDEWGERSTLYHSTDKIIATMKDLGAIVAEKPGTYHIGRQEIKNEKVASFLLCSAMKVDGGSYYAFNELNTFNILFPFQYTISKESLMEQECFTITTFGGDLTVTLKND